MTNFSVSSFQPMGCYSLMAKYNSQKGWLPYWAHALDTAGVMEKLANHWLSKSTITCIQQNIGQEDIIPFLQFVALVHDMGKLTPIFQSKISQQSSFLKEKIEKKRFYIPDQSTFLEPNATPHAFAGEAILRLLGVNESVACIVGAHHGKTIPDYQDVLDILECYEENFYTEEGQNSPEGDKWKELWHEWLQFALDLCGYASVDALPVLDVTTQMLLSGLLVMADWMASNEEYAPLLLFDECGETLEYWQRTDDIWQKISLTQLWSPLTFSFEKENFKETFGFLPNEVQKQMIEAVEEATQSGLYILEAPMGQGKTEAALAATEILASRWECGGLFFGLPTQATANGIFPRLKEWGEKQSEQAQLSIRLAHGMAMLQQGYREIFHGKASQELDAQGGLLVHEWFEGRKQALLASFVVGTVDQLLMAGLRQKHVMLRHLGLAGKVVVIDECHAYDVYMSTYLERVLYWLGVYQVPVILLSATLPSKRRAELVLAYHGNRPFQRETQGWKESTAYPLLTYTQGDELCQHSISTEMEKKNIALEFATQQEICTILLGKMSQGGCAGIVVNSVATAQSIAQQIQDTLPDFEVLLVHARFTVADRQCAEQLLLSRLGKNSTPSQRNRLVVVGTQILEQSLDIDFDLLITQLAPMDLLLQRMGRLHRHTTRKERPQKLQSPCCVVLDRECQDVPSIKIYGEYLLQKTASLLGKSVCLPDDISPLVQDTYHEPLEDDELFPLWKEMSMLHQKKEGKAEKYLMPRPESLEKTLHGITDIDVGDNDSSAKARVRDGEASISVLLMVEQEEEGYLGFLPWQSRGERIACDHVPSEDECCKILQQSVALPRILSVYKFDACVRELESKNMAVCPEWQRSKWLHGELVLILDKNLTTDLCGYRIRYDKKMGLLCEKEDE